MFVSSQTLRAGDEPTTSGPSDLVIIDYDVPPKPLSITRPIYPPMALEEGVEGTVLLELVIDKSGRVGSAKVLKSIPELDQAALECVRKWRFKPATKAGRPVGTVAQAPVTFRRDVPKDTKS